MSCSQVCVSRLHIARHEVMLFLSKFVKVLQTLILTWDEHKYISGVDTNGDQRDKQAKKEKDMLGGCPISLHASALPPLSSSTPAAKHFACGGIVRSLLQPSA